MKSFPELIKKIFILLELNHWLTHFKVVYTICSGLKNLILMGPKRYIAYPGLKVKPCALVQQVLTVLESELVRRHTIKTLTIHFLKKNYLLEPQFYYLIAKFVVKLLEEVFSS